MSSPSCFVTGAARGIGRACAETLVEHGYTVTVADIDHEQARRAAEELGPQALAVRCDVRSTESVDAAVRSAHERWGRLDALVNNAGVIDPQPLAHASDESWQTLLDVHLEGARRCCRAAYPALTGAPGAAVVNLTSVAAHVGIAGRASYGTAKAALEGLTRVLAVEWAPDGIRVNAVAPGFVRTRLVERAVASGLLENERLSTQTALGRLGEPAEIGAAVHFLVSAAASYITGQVVVVDGGYLVKAEVA